MKNLFIKISCLFTFLAFANASAQSIQNITIQAFPPQGQFTVEDLWNFNIIVSGTLQYSQYIAVVSLSNNYAPILNATSKYFALSPGITVIAPGQLNIVQPINVSYLNSSIQSAVFNNGGYFSSGNYYVDIVVYGIDNTYPDGLNLFEAAQTSYTIEFNSIMPPHLVFVFNNDTINSDDINNTVFSWTAPYPLSPSQSLSYYVVFKEVFSGQSEIQAMNSNAVLYDNSGVTNTFYQLPNASTYFQPGKSYTWKVIAYIDQLIMETETWVFHVDSSKAYSKSEDVIIYTEPKRKPDGSYYISLDKKIYLRYYEEYQVYPEIKYLNFRLIDYERNVIAGVDRHGDTLVYGSPLIPIHKGTNYICIDLTDVNNIPPYEYYMLEVWNEKNEVWYLRVYMDYECVNC